MPAGNVISLLVELYEAFTVCGVKPQRQRSIGLPSRAHDSVALERAEAHLVADVIAGLDLERGVVAPLIGIGDLHA